MSDFQPGDLYVVRKDSESRRMTKEDSAEILTPGTVVKITREYIGRPDRIHVVVRKRGKACDGNICARLASDWFIRKACLIFKQKAP